MVIRMSGDAKATRRADRLLRWYPKEWRERYGEEFVDHLEQEFADRSVDSRRTLNIAYKGLVARVGDVGLSNATVSAGGQTRAAVGTSFVLMVFVAVLALNFWSRAMGLWSSRRYHPIPVSLTTGILTVTEGLMLVVLVAIVLTVVVSAARQIRHGRARALAGPSILAAASGAFLLYSVRWVPTELYRYVHGYHGRPGIGWSQPGPAIAALGQTAWGMTQQWVALWNEPFGNPTSYIMMSDLVPIALLLFGIAIALLVRRVELPRLAERLGTTIVTLLGTLTGVFLVTYVVWLEVDGPSGNESFWPEGARAGGVYLVLLGLVSILVGRTRWLARSNRYSSTPA
jgi:hypothetical protein